MSASIEKELTIKVSRVSIVINILLTLMKLIAGVVAHSGAMVADAVHSASDVFGSFLVIIGANVSGKAADQNHPYGHDRMECVISIVLANILLLVGLGIGISGLEKVIAGRLQPVGCARPLGADGCGYLHCSKRRTVLVYADCC